jgi:hypothetical protein
VKLARTQAKPEQIAAALGMKPHGGPSQLGQAASPETPPPPQPKPQSELVKEGTDLAGAEARELERAYSTRVEFDQLALKRFEPLAYSVSSDGFGAAKPNATPKPPEETFMGAISIRGARG